jgi:hypothetical protein
MPNQLPQVVEERIVAFSLGHPGLGPCRIAAMLARLERGPLRVSANGVWKVLRRHGPQHPRQATVLDRRLPHPGRAATRARASR